MKRMTVLFMTSLLCCVVAPVVSASPSTQLFFDDFTGTALDTSLWSIFVDANGQYHWPYVADGLLHSQGYHTRIDSIPTFAPMGQSVMARARIRLAGDYHEFGFGVGAGGERAGPISGYYFDTYNRFDESMGREDYVHAVAWFQPAFGSPVNLLDVEIPVTWYEFHEFAVERTPSEVIYSIDGQEVARVADAFAGALPVCVWNARWDLMLTDWVEVSQIASVTIDATVSIDPDTLNLNSKGKWVTCYVELPEGYEASDIDVDSVSLEGLLEVQQSDIQDGVLMVKFDREDLAAYLEVLGVVPPVEVELVVMGKLTDGTPFEGRDTIGVIDEGGGK
jgi:hypothetical protein